MLVSARVSRELEDRKEEFVRAAQESARLVEQYHDALDQLNGLSVTECQAQLLTEQWPGARPTPELDQFGLVSRFPEHWETAQEARAWALDMLRGTTTVAIDGSQIAESQEFGVPVSLAQVAWFENPHDSTQAYVKEVRNEIVTAGESVQGAEDFAFAESRLNQRRFALEMQVARDHVERLDPEPLPVVLIDGTFVLSFIGRMAPAGRAAYLEPLFALLEASERRRIPVVGYVDASRASDLITMIHTLFALPTGSLFDARILTSHLHAFDRTASFICARGDVMPNYRVGDRDSSADLCFVYLQIGPDRMPARLDFPRWMLEEGILPRVIDVVRAEIVVGTGYPYALETADATAVLTMEDRLTFFHLFHEFARSAGLSLGPTRKSVSKSHRR